MSGMKERAQLLFRLFSGLRFAGVVLLTALVLVFCALLFRGGEEAADVSRAGQVVASDCLLVQTMRFTRCLHQVTRRVNVTQNAVGLDRAGLEKRYKEWQLETFSEGEVTMSKDVELFCPMHYVLMADESGGLAAYQNRYGDAMAWLETLPGAMSDYDAATQERLLLGIGYDSMEKLKAALAQGLR